MAIIRGTANDDVRSGTTGHDIFQFFQGGTDNLFGDAGNDIFKLGGALSIGDTINGGTGVDRLYLNGDYSGGFTFGDDALFSVEHIRVSGAFDYSLTTDDVNVAAGEMLTLHADTLAAGHALTFNGSAETDGRFTFYGSAGNDTLTGGAKADVFNLARGGNDNAYGGGGTDRFTFGTNFGGGAVDGGGGQDVVLLLGDHHSFVFGATTMTNVETLRLGGGYEFTLTSNDATVAAGATLVVDGSAVTSGDDFDFNGGAETDGHFTIIGSAAHNYLTGGAQADTFLLNQNNDDDVSAGGGDDTITIGQFTTGHTIDGGDGYDILQITGANGSDELTLTATTMTNIEKVVALIDNTVRFRIDDATVAAGETLEVDGTAVTGHNFSFYADSTEHDGHLLVRSGGLTGTITGGDLSDTIIMQAHSSSYTVRGDGDADDITLNTGSETLQYVGAGDSTSTGRDVIHGFNADVDKIDLVLNGISAFAGTFTGNVSAATFDTDMGVFFSDNIHGNDAWIVHAGGGDLINHDFLAIDTDNDGFYDGGIDFVMEITGYTGTFDASDIT